MISPYYWLVAIAIVVGITLAVRVLIRSMRRYPPKTSRVLRAIWYLWIIVGGASLGLWIFIPLAKRNFSDLVYLAMATVFGVGGVSMIIIHSRQRKKEQGLSESELKAEKGSGLNT
jgi:uncharacterized membrane protein